MDTTTPGPNPLCEVGMRHPRDRHRMRPVDGAEHVWFCPKHDIYAQLVDLEVAKTIRRSDPWTDYAPIHGVVVKLGDERQGGQIVYFREDPEA